MNKNVSTCPTENSLSPANILRFPVQLRLVRKEHSFRVSQDVQSRVYFPARVRATTGIDLFPLTARQHADAVYDNAVRFLESVQADEALR